MKLINPVARKGMGLLFALTLLSASQGCSKTTDYGLGNTQGDSFSNGDRSDKLTNLRADYNADIVIKDQSYESEHDVNNVLRYLAANEGSLKDKLKDVVEIDIGSPSNDMSSSEDGTNYEGAVQWTEAGNGKFTITINCHASSADIDAGMQKFGNAYQGTAILDATSARVGMRIVDQTGLSTDQANSFTSELVTATAGLDFTTASAQEYVAVLQIDNVFAMGAIGSHKVLVRSDANSDDLHTFLAAALDLAKHLDQDLASVTSLLGEPVTYQPATLIPSEISQGIVSLSAAVNTIRSSTRAKGPFMIGRRTETDASLVKSSGKLLIAFNASAKDITNALNLLNPDNTNAVTQAIADATTWYSLSHVTFAATPQDFGITDVTTDASLGVVQNTLQRLEATATIALLTTSMITTITPTPGASNVQGNGTAAATLLVNLSNLDQSVLSEALSSYANTYAAANMTAARMTAQQNEVAGMTAKYSAVSFQSTAASYDISSSDKTQALANMTQAFVQIATPALLAKIGITTVILTATAASTAESVMVSADKTTLTIDLYMATPSVLTSVLQAAATPAPAPVTPPAPPSPPSPTPAAE